MTSYKYTGEDGEYLIGVPARDLSHEDVEALHDAQREELEVNVSGETPIYEVVEDAPPTTPARATVTAPSASTPSTTTSQTTTPSTGDTKES